MMAAPSSEVDLARLELLLAARKVSELRDFAARHGVDVARARKRKEIARALALSPAAATIWSEVVPPTAGPAIPSMDDAEADRLLYVAKNAAAEGGRALDLLAQARARFEARDFERAVALSEEAALVAGPPDGGGHRSAWAITILGCQRLVEDSARAGREVSEAVDLVRAAKRAFREGDRRDPDSLRRLAAMAQSLHATERGRARAGIAEVAATLDKAAGIGAELSLAQKALDRARDALARNDPFLCLQALSAAEGLAREAVDARVQDIEEGLQATEALIREGRNVGADVAEAERLLDQARSAFGEKQVLLAGQLVKRSERSALRSQQSQIQKAIDLRRRQVERGMAILAGVEPLLAEADAYGIDTAEPRVLSLQARDILAKGDYVNGTLFARNAASAARSLEPRLLEERIRRGLVKPQSGVCANCGSRRLAFRDNGWAQCLECGRAFRWRTILAAWRRLTGAPRA